MEESLSRSRPEPAGPEEPGNGRWLEPGDGHAVDAGEILGLASRIAGRLAALRTPGRHLAISGLPVSLAAAALLGAWRAGWPIAPIRWDAPATDRQAMLSQLDSPLVVSIAAGAGADCTVQSSEGQGTLDQWLAAAAPPAPAKAWTTGEAAAVLFTSGSAGRPKGVLHSQDNLRRAAALFADNFQLRDGERLACMAPVHTASGLRSLVLPTVRRVDVALWARGTGGLAETMESLARLDPHVLLCGPQFVATLAAAGRRIRGMLPSLRCVACTGAPLAERDRDDAVAALGIEVLNFYGLTETGGIVLAERPGQVVVPGALPPPCPGVEARLLPAPAHPGLFELEIVGPNVYLGYLHQHTGRRGRFATGDLVQRDAHGHLRLVGRIDNACKSPGSEWIFPERLEGWLRNQAGVRDAHVTSRARAPGRMQALHVVLDMAREPVAVEQVEWRNRIAAELGPEYSQLTVELGLVERSALGKIPRPDERTAGGPT